jgi:hypothetical protein
VSTFLELVQDLARDSGTLAGGVNIQTVTLAGNARADKMIGWVRKAWVNIQNERSDWPWMRREFSAPLTIGKVRYTAADFGIARFGQWVRDRPRFCTFSLWDTDIGQADEGAIREVDYDLWRARYGRGAPDANRPTCWAISPMQEWVCGAMPDKAYQLVGEYRLAPQILQANNDVPELPEQYHRAILWEAMKLLGIADESPATTSGAISEYVLVRQNLDRDYLPEITIGGGPLA